MTTSPAPVRLTRTPRRTPLTWIRGGGPANLLFLLPMLVIFGVFSWGPIVESVVMSLQHTNFVTAPTFVGADNFLALFRDPLVPIAVQNTAYFALLALIFGYPIPLVVAVLMSEVRRARGLFSALAYLPVVVPPVVAVLLWKVFFDASPHGLFNTILSWVGIGPQPWIQSAATAMPSIVLEATWAAAGSTVIIYLAALTSVPPELYDAAEVDGAGIWQKIWHVTLPQLRPVLLVTFILQIIGTAQVFLEPFLLTFGGPANSTLTILQLIFRYAFQNSIGLDYGKATALSILLALFLALFSLVYFRITKSWSENLTTTTATPSGTLSGGEIDTVETGATPRPVRKPRKSFKQDGDRGIASHSDWRRPGVWFGMSTVHFILLILLILWGIGPLLWLLKSAITPTQDTLYTPLAVFPHGWDWSNVATAWNTVGIGVQFLNTIWVALGSWFVQLFVATTAGYALAVLRPRYAPIFNWLVLATLFVPGVVLLVPLYITVLHPPLIGHSLIDTFWAVWLPAGANAFNILLVTRFFNNLPREIFEAARTDGAGPFRLFWSIVLPMSRPILGVVSVFAIINAWKDYLWPRLVLTNPAVQPLSVRLPNIQSQTDLGVFLAALAISMIIPIVLFLIFQRLFLRSAGLGGAVKG